MANIAVAQWPDALINMFLWPWMSGAKEMFGAHKGGCMWDCYSKMPHTGGLWNIPNLISLYNMKINCVSIIVQCFLCTVNKISARKHLIVHAILFPTVSRWRCFNFYSTDHLQNKVANGGNGPEQFPIQAHLFYRVLRGQIENFAAYEFLSIL